LKYESRLRKTQGGEEEKDIDVWGAESQAELGPAPNKKPTMQATILDKKRRHEERRPGFGLGRAGEKHVSEENSQNCRLGRPSVNGGWLDGLQGARDRPRSEVR